MLNFRNVFQYFNRTIFTDYTFDFKIRFITSFAVVFAYAYLFEKLREKDRNAIDSKSEELSQNLIVLEKIQEDLQKNQDELELRVEQRTAELKKTNDSLYKEIDERLEAQKALAESQERFLLVLNNSFEQVENSARRKFQGTGLGLSLTKKFVELHHGEIWAESPGEGQGATFNFTLPER